MNNENSAENPFSSTSRARGANAQKLGPTQAGRFNLKAFGRMDLLLARGLALSATALILLLTTGCTAQAGVQELAEISANFPEIDDLAIESAERVEVVRFAGSETFGFEQVPAHNQRYIPKDGNDFDDVIADLATAVSMARFATIEDDCFQATAETGAIYTARIYQFDENVTTPPVSHVLLQLSAGDHCFD